MPELFKVIKLSEYWNGDYDVPRWDLVVNKKDNETYVLVPTTDVDSLASWRRILSKYGLSKDKSRGRFDTETNRLPFFGPVDDLDDAGEAIGCFVKIYRKKDSAWRCQKEFDSIQYLGSLPVNVPNAITSKNFPKPRICNRQVLVLPLVLSTHELAKFVRDKINFYKKHFQMDIDMDHCEPAETESNKRKREDADVETLCRAFEEYSINVMLRKKITSMGFLHGDAVFDCNVLCEDSRSVYHRLTGEWPTGSAPNNPPAGLLIVDSEEENNSIAYLGNELHVLIDYDTVYFTNQPSYEQSIFDYCTETEYVIQRTNDYDISSYFTECVAFLKDLIRDVAAEATAATRKPCCVAFLDQTQGPVRLTDDKIEIVARPPVVGDDGAFHSLHVRRGNKKIRPTDGRVDAGAVGVGPYVEQYRRVVFAIVNMFHDVLKIRPERLSVKKIIKFSDKLRTMLDADERVAILDDAVQNGCLLARVQM